MNKVQHRLIGLFVEPLNDDVAVRCQRQVVAAPIGEMRRHGGEAGIGKLAQDAAEIAAIHAQGPCEIAGGGVPPGVDLVEDARLGQA